MASVPSERPLVVITGAAGSIGTALVALLRNEYALVGLALLSVRRGLIEHHFEQWDRMLSAV